MKKLKVYLAEMDMKIKELSDIVGYSSQHVVSVFKGYVRPSKRFMRDFKRVVSEDIYIAPYIGRSRKHKKESQQLELDKEEKIVDTTTDHPPEENFSEVQPLNESISKDEFEKSFHENENQDQNEVL